MATLDTPEIYLSEQLETPFIVLTSNADTMNFLESCAITDPYGYSSECAEFTIYDVSDAFGLKDITSSGRVYTISFWLKSNVSGFVRTTGGGTFKASSTWTRCVSTFTAESSDFVFSFDTVGTYYIYHAQLEIGNKATDWSPSPEDMATNEDVTALSTKYSELEQTVDGFKATVSETYATKTTVTEVSNAASKAQSTADTAVSNAATAQSAAEGAQSTADTAVSNAATAQSTAEGAQSTADTAVSNAATAQSTADTAVSNAATAQSTADTAVSNAATAQKAADDAQSTADTAVSDAAKAQQAADDAQADVDTLTITVTENYATKTSVEQTAKDITQTVSETYSTKTEVAAIKIGAKNLIRNSENLVFSSYYFTGYLNPPEIYLTEVIDV